MATSDASSQPGKRITQPLGKTELTAIKQSAGQEFTRHEKVTWRSWEPAGGGSKPPLILLHPLPHSGSFFSSIAPLLAQDRFVFAPDYPGYGASWPLPGPPTISLYAQSVIDAWDKQGQEEIPDLLGFHTGCLVAPELAITCPEQVRRLVLVDVPYFSAAECKLKLQEPWAVDGFMAAFSYPAEERFRKVQKKSLVIATQSSLQQPSREAVTVLQNCALLELPEVTSPAFENGAIPIAVACLEFLDNSPTD